MLSFYALASSCQYQPCLGLLHGVCHFLVADNGLFSLIAKQEREDADERMRQPFEEREFL